MLGKIFGKKNSATTKTPSSGVYETIVNVIGERSIPAMPAAAQQAFLISSDPNADARNFIDLFEADEALAARVIKIANSVFYDRGAGSKSLEQAVAVIGLSDLRCLLSANSLSELFPSRHILRTYLWQHDVATAIAARTIATHLAPELADSSFLAGLMHDIGKLLLLQQTHARYEQVVKTVFETGQDFEKVESDIFAFNHLELGQLIASRWNFSSELIDAISSHNQAPNDSKFLQLNQIIYLADLYAHSLSLANGRSSGAFSNTARQRLEELVVTINLPHQELCSQIKHSYELESKSYIAPGTP